MKRTYMRRKPKRNPMPSGRRDEVYERSGGRCEACGTGLTERWECHHRRTRGMGGTARPEAHTLSNLLALCVSCHDQCTNPRDGWPRIWGWVVPQAQEPARVPVLYRTRWVLLTDDGGLLEVAA